MEVEIGFDIKGLDAYPEVKINGRFLTKEHLQVKCPRYDEVVDVVFSRKGRPMCLSHIGLKECDFCRAFNLTWKKDVPESIKQQVLQEHDYWQRLKVLYAGAQKFILKNLGV